MALQGEFEIRPARKEDVEAIRKCLESAFAPYRGQDTPDAHEDTVPSLEDLGKRLEKWTVFVAVDSGRTVVGTVSCSLASPSEGHLRGMAVLPPWQGSPVAANLLDAAERQLARRGRRVVSLETTSTLSRAMRFYEKNGFERSGKVTDYFGMPLHEYVKKLPAPLP